MDESGMKYKKQASILKNSLFNTIAVRIRISSNEEQRKQSS